jgi:hypothetical protein
MNALVNVTPSYGVGDLERMARAFAASKLFGVQNAEQALALCLVAQAEGRHPASAAQDYHIISGRPAKKADAMLRDFISAGGKVEWHKLDNETADATFSHPYGGTVRIDWTLQRAQAAGIANPMWKKYPRQMLRSRVVSEGVRTVCPGATSGMYVPEEMQDIVHEQVSRPPAPVQTRLPALEPEPDEPSADERPLAVVAAEAAIIQLRTVDECDAWDAENGETMQGLPKAQGAAVWNFMVAHRKSLETGLRQSPRTADFRAEELEGAL